MAVAVLPWDIPHHRSPRARGIVAGLRNFNLLAGRSRGDTGASGHLRGNREVGRKTDGTVVMPASRALVLKLRKLK